MESKRGLLILGLPLAAGLALLAGAVALRRDEPTQPLQKQSKAPRRELPASTPAAVSVREIPKPAAPDVLVKAEDEVRIRGTYQNYRSAVASGNAPAQEALEKALRRDRDQALRLAQEDLAKSQDARDRDIALRTLEALRR